MQFQDGEERSDDGDLSSPMLNTTTETDTASLASPSLVQRRMPLSLSRQASRSSLLQTKLNLPISTVQGQQDKSKSSPGSPASSSYRSYSGRSGSDSEGRHQQFSSNIGASAFPPIPTKNTTIIKRFPGLERRRFALPQKFISLQSIDIEAQQVANLCANGKQLQSGFAVAEKKIGFFYAPQLQDGDNQSTSDEFSGGGLLSDDSSSDSSSSDSDDVGLQLLPPKSRTPVPQGHKNRPGGSLRGPISEIDRNRRRPRRTTPSRKPSGNPVISRTIDPGSQTGTSVPATSSRTRTPLGTQSSAGIRQSGSNSAISAINTGSGDTGRTFEQGRDFLIELEADLLSVYGQQSLRFLDRPWNRQRALKATTVQFNFVSFDDLVPYLPRFRQTFPNVENFEFIETDIRALNQLNALSLVQGITSLNIGSEGNPISAKGKLHEIRRLIV